MPSAAPPEPWPKVPGVPPGLPGSLAPARMGITSTTRARIGRTPEFLDMRVHEPIAPKLGCLDTPVPARIGLRLVVGGKGSSVVRPDATVSLGYVDNSSNDESTE